MTGARASGIPAAPPTSAARRRAAAQTTAGAHEAALLGPLRGPVREARRRLGDCLAGGRARLERAPRLRAAMPRADAYRAGRRDRGDASYER
jgi:hypothetical protein